MKKIIGLIGLLILGIFIAGCIPAQKVDIKSMNDADIGKEVTVSGNVINRALDSHSCGWINIQDATGTLYITGGCQSLVGPFGGIYDSGTNTTGSQVQFYVESATGTIQKGFNNEQVYYLELPLDLNAIKISEIK